MGISHGYHATEYRLNFRAQNIIFLEFIGGKRNFIRLPNGFAHVHTHIVVFFDGQHHFAVLCTDGDIFFIG